MPNQLHRPTLGDPALKAQPWTICGALLLATVVIGGLWVIAPPDAEDPTKTSGIPSLTVGTKATYELEGPPRTLLQPIVGASPTFQNTTRVDVEVGSGDYPSPTGTLTQARSMVLRLENGTFVAGALGGDQAGFAFAYRAGVQMDFERLRTVRFRPVTGPLDAFLFENETLPSGDHPVEEIAPEVATSKALTARSVANATISVRWVMDDGEWQAQVAVEGIREVFTHDTLAVTYRFTPDCPLPERIRFPETEGAPAFHAKRLTCDLGDGPAQIFPVDWKPATTEPFERSLPGEGTNLPIPYRPAFQAFLQEPDTVAFRQDHPDGRLACAAIHPDSDRDPWDRSWYFRIASGGDSHGNWTGQLNTTSPLEDAYPRDPTPPTDRPCIGGGHRAIETGTPVAPVDLLKQQLENVLDRSVWDAEAELDDFVWTANGSKVSLSRCAQLREDTGGGSCGEVVPTLYVHLDGTVDQIDARPSWFEGDLPELFADSVDG